MDGQRDKRHDEEHGHGVAIDMQAKTNVDISVFEPRNAAHDGLTDGMFLARLGKPCAEGTQASADGSQCFGARLPVPARRSLHPLHDGCARQAKDRNDPGDTKFGSPEPHLLSEEQSEHECPDHDRR